MILAIDPGNEQSAYVLLDKDLKPIEFGIEKNGFIKHYITSTAREGKVKYFVIEMVASYGMAVGKEVFETVFWIGRFWEHARLVERHRIYRKDVKSNLCHDSRAKDGNIAQALIDRFAYGVSNKGKGTKKEPGWFFGFKADIWQAYAVGVTFADLRLK